LIGYLLVTLGLLGGKLTHSNWDQLK